MTDWTDLEVATPALVLDRGRALDNHARMRALTAAHGVSFWPHAKTHRIPELGMLQLEHGADGLTVAKLGEAEAFADAGARRLFVAYPLVGRGVAERSLALAERLDELVLGVDSVEGARVLGDAFAAAGRSVTAYLAIDTGLGREGALPADAPGLARAIADLDGVDLAGLYSHEGSVYTAASPAERDATSISIARDLVALGERMRADGVAIREISLGASASAWVVPTVPGITQVRPGISLTGDLGQIALGTATPESTAVRVIATVVSRTAPDRGCIDAGSKALSADLLPASAHRDELPGHGLIEGHPGWVIDRVSEEHGWLRWHGAGEPTPLPVGTRVSIIPNHVCTVFAALRRAHIVDDGRITHVWDAFGPGTSV
jgi:D-serine deaminase-like pyridoxal phosphate-dependent protein